MTVEDIIYKYCQGMMFPDPDYYNGRGNDMRDLNSEYLEFIYKGIRAEIGEKAARAYVNMVKNLKNTNAKSFLLELYRLERKEWNYTIPIIKMQVAPAGPPRTADDAPALSRLPPVKRIIEVANAFSKSGSNFGHEKKITERFLDNHKTEIERSSLSGDYTDVSG